MSSEIVLQQPLITIAWWNVGLRPPSSSAKPKEPKDELVQVMVTLCEACDMVCFGEYVDMPDIRQAVEEKNRNWKDLHYKTGKLHFNNGIFYNPENFTFETAPEVFHAIPGQKDNYRIGQKIKSRISFIDPDVEFYLVHWASYSETDSEQMKCSAALTLANEFKESQNVFQVCMGDFNTEPYSAPMATLGSSRNANYVCQHGGFYNPFWRHLPYDGTLEYPNHRALKCHAPLFDQILLNQQWLIQNRYEFESEVVELPFPIKKGEHRPVKLTITEKQ